MDSDSLFLKIICGPCFHSKGQVKNICDFSQEPDGAMMLQSHSNSFFPDPDVEKMEDAEISCSSSYWDCGNTTGPVPWISVNISYLFSSSRFLVWMIFDVSFSMVFVYRSFCRSCALFFCGNHGFGTSTKFDHNGNCGNGESCSRQAQNGYSNCWDIPSNCTASSPVSDTDRFYTKKFDEGENPGSSVTVTPPSYACIIGTCAKNGGGRDCIIISPAVIGQPVTIAAPANKDSISNFRVQYACGLNCEPISTTQLGAPDPVSIASTTGGAIGGDPHIRTMTGERYTLMKQGDFLAFSFKGKEAHSDLLPHKVWGLTFFHDLYQITSSLFFPLFFCFFLLFSGLKISLVSQYQKIIQKDWGAKSAFQKSLARFRWISISLPTTTMEG